MELKELIKHRQSDRSYTGQEIEKEKIVQCLEAARLAPSANNSQPWKFIVVDDPDLKDRVADCSASLGMNKFTFQAPVLVVVVLEKENILSSIGGKIKDKVFCHYDIGIAVSHFCLQAAELGLGSCIIGWFNEKKVKKLLNINRKRRVPLIISLGYPGAPVRPKKRKSLSEISSWNIY
ncbi:MAG TPA: nitroreductase family protein [Bacteroidales bacterium]|nr:nitroreductase family protein [Bacteroidales bacterium]HPW78567.1 nitroreductase family protein [Bacteroidales bacterium]HQB55778.1 nitroreductase family protein [Bacteroidales bacterium]